jgi:hypothetical protein
MKPVMDMEAALDHMQNSQLLASTWLQQQQMQHTW